MHRHSQEFVLKGAENRGTEGAEIETPKASRSRRREWGWGDPLRNRLEGLGGAS